MVAVHTDAITQRRQFLIRPNCSASRRGAWLFLLIIAGGTLIVNGYFASLGAWMVLPFAGLELIVLGGAMHLLRKAAACSELITITDQSLRIERRCWPRTQVWDFQRYWVQVILRQDPRNWYPSRLLLRSHGREIPVGECLTEAERRQLARDLAECMVVRH